MGKSTTLGSSDDYYVSLNNYQRPPEPDGRVSSSALRCSSLGWIIILSAVVKLAAVLSSRLRCALYSAIVLPTCRLEMK